MKMQHSDFAKLKNAKWAADIIAGYPQSTGLTTRVLHYLALHHKKPDGTVYANTLLDYNFLQRSCEHAQFLGLVPYQILDDCNFFSSPPNLFSPGRALLRQQSSGLFKQMFDRLCISYVRCIAAMLSPVHTEIWLENSTAASVISPVAIKYNVNLIASHGSIPTAVIFQFIRRTCHASIPIRILHLSDFDPANVNFPAQTEARVNSVLEHFRLGNKYDLKMRHLMLTRRQFTDLNLPSEPCDANSRNAKIELNALEAFRPGYINEMLEQNLGHYIDLSSLRKKMSKTQTALEQMLPPVSRIIDSKMV